MTTPRYHKGDLAKSCLKVVIAFPIGCVLSFFAAVLLHRLLHQYFPP